MSTHRLLWKQQEGFLCCGSQRKLGLENWTNSWLNFCHDTSNDSKRNLRYAISQLSMRHQSRPKKFTGLSDKGTGNGKVCLTLDEVSSKARPLSASHLPSWPPQGFSVTPTLGSVPREKCHMVWSPGPLWLLSDVNSNTRLPALPALRQRVNLSLLLHL